MKNKILILVLSFVLFAPLVAKADILLPPTPIEPSKNAVDCIRFFGLQNLGDYNLFATVIQKKTDDYREFKKVLVLVEEGACYHPHPNPGNFMAQDWAVRQGTLIANLFLLPNNETTADFLAGLMNTKSSYFESKDVVFNYDDNFDTNYDFIFNGKKLIWLNELVPIMRSMAFNNGTKDNIDVLVIKENSPIKTATERVEFKGIVPAGVGVVATSSVNFDRSVEVTTKAGEIKNFTWLEYINYINNYRPVYENNNPGNGDGSYWNTYSLAQKLITGLGFLLTILIESIIFYLFGARGRRNYLCLFLVNFLSYFIGLKLFEKLAWKIFEPFFSPNNLQTYLLVEVFITIFEFGMFYFLLRKRYKVKDIAIFSVVANVATILLGIIGMVVWYDFNYIDKLISLILKI